MLICLIAVFLLGIVAALGYLQGAVRLLVSLVGLFLGIMLAFPLAPKVQPLVVWMGVKHPVWLWIWPPVIVLFTTYFLFLGVSFLVHRKLELFYKYGTDDLGLFRWERVNKRLGICVGLLMGGIWFQLIGMVISVVGYLTVQVASDDTNPPLLRYLNQARQDLRNVGLERIVAVFDPMPETYYQVADILGLLYQNPLLAINRLPQYPPFLAMGERAEFQDIANDKDYKNLLLTKPDVTQIINNSKTQAIITNQEILQELLKQDFKDLRRYLETGKSLKYDDEKILGNWKIDVYTTVAQERRKHPDISASEMTRRRREMNEVLPGVTFKATTDHKASRKAPVIAAAKPAAPPAAAAANSGLPPGMSPEMAQRYGLGRGGAGPRGGGPPPPPPPPANVPPPLVASGGGTWQLNDGKYLITLQDEKGKALKEVATADDERLIIQTAQITLVFVKAD